MLLFRRIQAGLLVLAVLGVIVLAATTAAQGPTLNRKNQEANNPSAPKVIKDAPEVKQPAPGSKVLKWSEKKIPAFEFSAKPWPLVFQWLADQSGLPFSSATYQPPGGSLSFSTPKGADGKPREYTLVEVWDIINEILQSEKKFTMLRRESVFQLYPADEMPPDHLVPFVLREDLDDRGKTDIVKVLIKVKSGNVTDIAVTVKRLLGDFGHVTPLEETNQLLLKSTVSAIRTVIKVSNFDAEEESALNHAHKCLYIRAATAEAVLIRALGSARQVIERKSEGKGPGGGPGFGGPGFGGPGFGGPGSGGPQPTSRTVREHTVTHEKSTNTVFIHGPSDKIQQAKEVLKQLDVPPSKGAKKILEGAPGFLYHELKGGSAENMVKILGEIYKSDETVRISVAGPSRLFVWADPQTHEEINSIVNKSIPAELKTESIALTRLDAVKFAETLKLMLPDATKGSPFIEANADNNAITVRGTEEQLKEVRVIIEVLDDSPMGGAGSTRMINLEKASGATVAEGLSLLLRQLRVYDVELIVPESLDDIKDIKLPAKKDLKPELKPEIKPPVPKKIFKITRDDVRDLIHQEGRGPTPIAFQGEEEKKIEEKKQEEPKTKVYIHGFGNRIMIKSSDKDALDLAQQMVRILVNTEAGPGDIKVIPLKVANAVEVAKILDEAFNGPKGQGGGGGGRGPGGGGPGGGGIGGLPGMLIGSVIPGLGGGGQQSSRIEAIRVVADPATNSLLVRARPIDMLTIRRLLTSELDRRDNNSDALVKTHHIQLKNANAVEVADLVRQVFAESMKAPQQSTQGSPGGFPFGFGGGQRPVDSTGGSKNVMLTVGADIHTNSIYLACPTTLYNEIATMVKTIEENSQDIRETMQIVSIKDIDPVTLQQVIDAFSGRATQQSRFSQQTATGFQGQFAPGAFGTSMRGLGFQSGFQPGMGGGGAFALPIPIGIPGAGGGIPSIGGPGTGGPGSGIRFPGGGGGGGPIRGGGGGKGRVSLERGPDFFVSRVTDDPPVRILFDPSEEQQEPPQPENDLFKRPSYSVNPLRLTSLTQPDEPGSEVVMTDATGTWRGTWVSTGSLITMTFPDRAVYNGRITGNRITGTARNSLNQVWRWDVTRVGPGTDFLGSEDLPGFGKLAFHFVGQAPRDEGLTSPRMGIQAEIIPQSGIMILRGNSKEDIRAILQIIELIRREAQPTLIEIELVPVRLGDPVDITETLKAIYSRLGITPYSTQILPPTTAPGGPAAPAGPGVVPAVAASTIPQPSNILFLPQIRLGGILVVASKARMKEIRDHIQRLDQMPSDLHHVVPIKLKRASAPRVAASLNTFYSTRFPLPGNVNAIRIAADDGSNSLLVQAAPADLKEIQRLVEHIDNTASDARAEVRVIQLKAAVATDLAALLQAAIANGVLTINAPPVQPGAATAGAVPPQVGPGGTVQYNLMSKDNTLVFRPSKSPNGKPIEARILEDIRINPDIRINALLVSAPSESMELIQALINEMDVPPMAKAEIRVFQLKKTDATQFANMLRTLFLGTTTTGTTTPAGPGPAGPGGGTQQRPPIFTINDQLSPGAPIIDVRVTIDERTNSLVVAGAYTDILVVESIFDRIENAKVPERLSEAIRLRNSQAADVANAVTTFINQLTTEYRTYNQGTNFLSLQRDVVVVAEPISNSLLINATPEYFDKVVQLIAKIDTAPPQVVIQVVVAEVTMTGSEEFGMEIGLQTPLVFNRGSLATAATPGIVFPTAGATYATFTPGYAFTNPATSVSGNNVLQNPSAVGFQGLSNTGVGRISPTSNIGGFVFSAGSDTVNVLIRALKVQGRLTVLSRPQITTLDNQTAYINIGQNVPVVGQVTQPTTATTLPFVSIDRYDIGVNMQVTPRITPDGRVLMRVIPEVSSISSSQINLGNGATGTIFNKQHLETTVVATDGETIILGGLITKNDNKTENKIPWVGDLPVVGAAFRYRTYNNTKTELIFIMTPHIIRNRGEMERVLIEEASRIDWKVSDLVRVHGPQNCMPFMPNIYPEPHGHHGHGRPYRSYPGVPAVAEWETQPDTPPTTLPAPTPVPPKPAPVPPKPAPMPVAPMAEPTAPLPLLLPEVAPEPARAPIGRGGLLKSLLNRRSETVVVRDMVETPLMRTTVEYSTPIPTSPLPEVISTGAVSPRPGDVGPSLSSPLPPITNIEP